MVARTLPFKSRDKPKPDKPLPSIPPDKMENKHPWPTSFVTPMNRLR
jgi:hypothetical protein